MKTCPLKAWKCSGNVGWHFRRGAPSQDEPPASHEASEAPRLRKACPRALLRCLDANGAAIIFAMTNVLGSAFYGSHSPVHSPENEIRR
jgi:hypothetical protein